MNKKINAGSNLKTKMAMKGQETAVVFIEMGDSEEPETTLTMKLRNAFGISAGDPNIIDFSEVYL